MPRRPKPFAQDSEDFINERPTASLAELDRDMALKTVSIRFSMWES